MANLTAIASWLAENPFLVLGGTVFSLLIGLLGIILTITHARSKKPPFALRSTNIITDYASEFPGLQVAFAGRAIPNLTASKIAFWNHGRETISCDDVATADPLLVRPKNGSQILDASLLHSSNPANLFRVHIVGGSCAVEFDYVDKGEGAIIQVLHTGKGSSDIQVRGTIKGAGAPRERVPVPRFRAPHFLVTTVGRVYELGPSFFAKGALVAGLAMIGFAFSTYWYTPNTSNAFTALVLALGGLSYVTFALYFLATMVPSTLNVFYE